MNDTVLFLIGLKIKYLNFIGVSRKIPHVLVCQKSKKIQIEDKFKPS